MFSSISQSPCDVAAELAGVCVGGRMSPPRLVTNNRAYHTPRVQFVPTRCRLCLPRTFYCKCKHLQVQLSLLLLAECLCVLPRPKLPRVRSTPRSFRFPPHHFSLQLVWLQHQLFNCLRHCVSLLSHAAYAQTYLLNSYTQQIPVGVKVPAYAYQDVSVSCFHPSLQTYC